MARQIDIKVREIKKGNGRIDTRIYLKGRYAKRYVVVKEVRGYRIGIVHTEHAN